MKKMVESKKGISPMIATILLIAMVIVIALIIFLWFRNMSKEAITKFNDENIELVCEDIEMEASYSNGIISVANNGNVPIYGLKVSIYTESGNEELSLDKESGESNLKNGINQGRVYTKDLSDKLSGATKVVIYPVLLGNSNDGTRTFTCSTMGIERSL